MDYARKTTMSYLIGTLKVSELIGDLKRRRDNREQNDQRHCEDDEQPPQTVFHEIGEQPHRYRGR